MATFQMNCLYMKIGMQTNITVILPSYRTQRGQDQGTFKEITHVTRSTMYVGFFTQKPGTIQNSLNTPVSFDMPK